MKTLSDRPKSLFAIKSLNDMLAPIETESLAALAVSLQWKAGTEENWRGKCSCF